MTTSMLLADLRAAFVRWAKLVPALLWHDPIFRYAAIAAALALFFLAARLAQDWAGPSTIPATEQTTSQGADGSRRIDERTDDAGASEPSEKPPRPGSATTLPAPEDALPLRIAPGRPLESIEVEPAPKDEFGTLPRKGPSP